MSKQTRRSVSISGELYRRLKQHCEAEGKSMSGMVETLCRASLSMDPRDNRVPRVVEVVRTVAMAPAISGTKPKLKINHKTRKTVAELARKNEGNIFTF